MAKLIYSAIASLDGYAADEEGKFDWAEPDEEVHAFINDLERSVGTYLYGRRMYESMAGWETDASLATQSDLMRDFAQSWQTADKIVYSKTLTVGGPHLAAHAFRARLVDECHLFIAPVIVSGGKQSLPDDVRLELELLAQRRFDGGVVHLCYGA